MPKALVVDDVDGGLHLLCRDLDERTPGPGEVRYQVHGIGLNRADLLYLAGSHYTPTAVPSRIGYEASGVVDAVGEGVTRFAVGDRVMSLPYSNPEFGVAGEQAITPEDYLATWPDELDAYEAAAVTMPVLTAYYPFSEVCRIGRDDAVYGNAASSSVGLGAIALAKMSGATVVAGTRTSAKADVLREAGADHLAVADDGDVAGQIRAGTGGRGVTVVLDAVAGSSMYDYADAMASGGRIFLYGALSGEAGFSAPILPLVRNAVCIELYSLIDYLADRRRRDRGRCFVELAVRSGQLRPYVDSVFDLTDFERAYERMRSGEQQGKIVLRTPLAVGSGGGGA